MTVFPGFGGQSFIADVMPKVTQVRAAVDAGALDARHRGGRRHRHHHGARRRGAPAPTCFVAGSAIFGHPRAVGGGRCHPGRGPRRHTVTGDAPAAAVVAGGGIIGTWHALELAEAGFAVDHLEAEAGPTGASVRNFGLVWVSGRRSGVELDVARRARRRWEEIGALAPGIGFRPMSSLTVATDAAAPRRHGGVRRSTPTPRRAASPSSEPDEVRACNPAVRGDIEGALHCTEDAVVEPRLALGALRAHLAATHGDRYRFHPGCRVVGAEPHALVDTTGTRWEGDLAVLATGAAYDHLPGTRAAGRPVCAGSACRCSRRRPSPRAHDLAGRRGLPALLPGLRVGAAGPARRRRPRWRPRTTCSCCWSSAPTAG